MNKKSLIEMAGVVAFGVFGCVAGAQAKIISSAPNTNFTNGGTTINLVLPDNLSGGFANYNFKDAGPSGFGGANYVSVKTGGGGELLTGNISGKPSTYFTDPGRTPFIDANLLGKYKSVDSYTKIPFSNTDSYLALALDLNDGTHYGYARIDGTNLINYGFQSEAGVGIQAGAVAPTSNPVPAPGSLAMLGFALALIGVGSTASRRRKS